jgi:hypothetical protein
MTKAEALEVKSITDMCNGTIPGHLVDRIFVYYQRYIDPTIKTKPCTCSGRYWTDFLFRLKDKVTDTLNSEETNSPIANP